MSKIRVYIEQSSVQNAVYRSAKLQSLERDVMERVLSEVRAAFLNEFGTEGKFNLQFQWGKVNSPYVNGVRPVYKVVAADAKTTVILKRNPGWLARFSQGARI